MTPRQARTVANVVLATAAAAAAYVVITTPPLRRLAMKAGRYYLGARIPMFLLQETKRAWQAPGPGA